MAAKDMTLELCFMEIEQDIPILFDLTQSEAITACRDYVISRLEEMTKHKYAISARLEMKALGAPDYTKTMCIRITDRIRLTFREASSR